jgi:ubiquinone biosynthesis protein COQ9
MDTPLPAPAALPDPTRILRDRLLDAALEEAAFDGWTRSTLARAAHAAGLSEGEALLAAPRGAVDLIDAWFDRAETAMVRALRDAPPGTKVRTRATLAVRARLDAMAEHREALRRAAVTLALPPHVPDALRIGWRAADKAWNAMGDTSTDHNWYTKRAILAGVHAATLAFWLQDDSLDSAPTWAFLDRRIGDVMRFEQVKGRIAKLTGGLRGPVGLLARLRYGPAPRP